MQGMSSGAVRRAVAAATLVAAALVAAGALAQGAGTAHAAGVDAGVAPSIPLERMQRMLVGTFEGSLECAGGARPVRLQLSAKGSDGEDLRVEGRFKTLDDDRRSPMQIDTAVTGLQHADTGLISMNSFTPRGERVGADFVWFTFEFARDAQGKGWAGVVYHRKAECRNLTLARTDGLPSAALPPIEGDDAFEWARLSLPFRLEDASALARPVSPEVPLMATRPTVFQGMYWLELAASQGHLPAMVALGKVHEYGLGTARDHGKALRYYAEAAAQDDAAAQEGLARLHAAGSGIPRDEAKSKRLEQQAAATRLTTRRLCTSKPVVEASVRMIHAQAQSPSAPSPAAMVGSIFNQRHIAIGSFAIRSIEAINVSNASRLFMCRITAQRIDTQVVDTTPFKQYALTIDNQTVYYDNRNDVEWGQASASLLQFLANTVPFREVVAVYPMEDQRYRLLLLQADPATGALYPVQTQDVTSRR